MAAINLVPADLPTQLSERVRMLRNGKMSRQGDYVLYWMHHAVRAHENPALEVAIHAGNALGRPVLVYQGLGGQHAYNSDRHHTFIMEGARDVQTALQECGITYAFHVPQKPSDPSPLRSLTKRAALVIAEDFPAPPFPRWTRRLADSAPTPVWLVDCQCIVPMRLLKKAYARAFEFRRATDALFTARLHATWEEVLEDGPAVKADLRPGLGFEPVDLTRADIAALCAQCEIDHSVSPVRHTPGGAVAGYQRWKAFKEQGLNRYHKLRNDATISRPLGVSGLSPYLHHGHVSPFRIGRAAAEEGSEGAQKFLDELLVWRELAHNFCFYTQAPERIEALPFWAQETLAHHRSDPRPRTYSWESLARGQTDDRLWNAAQKSLVMHGELHNNVRMTWGKAFLGWTETPEDALALMVDLNHRYALDGSDPNSYGGILYCLGLFDRPFNPARSIHGTVRPRPTAQQAARLDLNRYETHVARPAQWERRCIAVIGAGIAGLSAARSLADAGHDVAVFDKGRGPGGRMATRRLEDCAFDHGAQYFTVKDRRFRRYVESWCQDGIVSPWKARVVIAKSGRFDATDSSAVRYIGVPSMSAVPEHLAASLHVSYGARVAALEPADGQWRLVTASGTKHGPFDGVILALPPPQAAPLLTPTPALAARVGGVALAPCWSVMVTFEDPLGLDIDAAFIAQSELAWVARNASKPGRPPHESWVLHATPAWSTVHLEADPEVVAEVLLSAFFESTGANRSRTRHLNAHRWRYAQALSPLTDGCLWNAEARIAVCGDWCLGSRIEGAFLSGMATAGRILGLTHAAQTSEGVLRASRKQ